MKKIYFACSIAGGRDHAHVYADIMKYIKATGVQILSELFADTVLKPEVGMKLDPKFVWQRDYNWVKQADAVIAEVTQPSLGVGYEIGKAEDWGKPTLALFWTGSGRRLSPMVTGNPHITVFTYEDTTDVQQAVKTFIEQL